MKNFIKNKLLFSFWIFNILAFSVNFSFFILTLVNSWNVVDLSYAQILSLLAYLSLILFTFAISNIVIYIYYKRSCIKEKQHSSILFLVLIAVIAVYSLYLIFSIPITTYNFIKVSEFANISILQIIRFVLECLICLSFIVYSSILLHKENKLRKLSSSSSPN